MAYVPQRNKGADWILAAICLALALAAYVAQMKWFDNATHRESVMISTVQFLFTVALGYYTNKIASGDSYQQSIKQFAFGAYRRASDIEKMIARLQRYVTDRPGAC